MAAWASSRRPAPRNTCATRVSRPFTRARPVSRRWTWSAASSLAEAVEFIVASSAADPRPAFAGAVPFLKLMGIVAGGWQMGRAALAAERKLESGDRNFLEAKIATARFYADHVLVQAPALRNT